MSFKEEIQLLQQEKPRTKLENLKRIEAERFKKECLAMNEEAILKLYEMYKEALRNQCESDFLFVCHPSLGYLMMDSISLPEEIKQKIKDYFEKDGFHATEGFCGPYADGFYLKYL